MILTLGRRAPKRRVVHIITCDGVPTNESASRKLLAHLRRSEPRLQYLQLHLKCSSHQCNLCVHVAICGGLQKSPLLMNSVRLGQYVFLSFRFLEMWPHWDFYFGYALTWQNRIPNYTNRFKGYMVFFFCVFHVCLIPWDPFPKHVTREKPNPGQTRQGRNSPQTTSICTRNPWPFILPYPRCAATPPDYTNT